MKRLRIYLIFFSVLLFSVPSIASIAPTDVTSIEAMISNHKAVRSVLTLRYAAETGVYDMHQTSQKEMTNYKDINNELDKYKRYFDIIDLILKSSATAFHTVNTVKNIKDNLSGYVSLLEEYRTKLLNHGSIWGRDTMIYNTSYNLVNSVKDDLEQTYKSYEELAEIVTGVRECTTEDLMTTLNSINESLDELANDIYQARMRLWCYMTIRLGYWNKDIYMTKSIKDIVKGSLDHWIHSGIEAAEILHGENITYKTLGGGSLIGGQTY